MVILVLMITCKMVAEAGGMHLRAVTFSVDCDWARLFVELKTGL